MKLIIIHNSFSQRSDLKFFQLMASCNSMEKMVFDQLSDVVQLGSDVELGIVLPQSHKTRFNQTDARVRYYDDKLMSVPVDGLSKICKNTWFLISNGQYVASLDQQWLQKNIKGTDVDIIAVHVDPGLNACREKVRFTSQGTVAGFRRLYAASAHVAEKPSNWPHHLLVKSTLLKHFLEEEHLSLDFQKFLKKSKEMKFKWRTLCLGGNVLDLSCEKDLLNFFRINLQNLSDDNYLTRYDHKGICESARILGKVQMGKNVTLGENSVIIGPAMIGHDVTVEANAIIHSSIIATGSHVGGNQRISNTIYFNDAPLQSGCDLEPSSFYHNYLSGIDTKRADYEVNNFRRWRGVGYANHLKRFFDIIFSVWVLLFFLPVFPVIALVIKLTSSGPVFFGHNRQGLHGKEFKCWKFRTMLVGADNLQAALRVRNEVDGPQFKIENDPRINGVGHFLRETCLDEIPQFFNVLCGQMSLVGPRPSPEKENSLCPPWRDARLSVRPGITGLWQICRTRQQAQDFQEWVYYDTQYVKTLSWKKDLWICLATVKELAIRFINQF